MKEEENKWHMDCGSSSWKCSDSLNEQRCILKYCDIKGCSTILHFLGTGHSLWLHLHGPLFHGESFLLYNVSLYVPLYPYPRFPGDPSLYLPQSRANDLDPLPLKRLNDDCVPSILNSFGCLIKNEAKNRHFSEVWPKTQLGWWNLALNSS